MEGNSAYINIKGARENNLKNLNLKIPHGKLIAITGISGSGKSSLAFDTIAAEAGRQYLETIPSFARQFSGKINRPDVDEIKGLYPVISISQKRPGSSARSTLGTVSEIYDYLRLLFARFGNADGNIRLSRGLFSFNSPVGACTNCKGIGLEEKISVDKLIADQSRTLREGALVPTLPNGYIMYSQLTIDALDTVCREHDFNVDIPWKDLSEEQKNVVLYGSDRIKVLKGKHTIESRLKWTGLKAKPREMGYYTGMITVMEDILRRDRNRNILRFTESLNCSHCHGKRLNSTALSVKYRGFSIDYLCEMELNELLAVIRNINTGDRAEKKLCDKIAMQLSSLCNLGMGYLQLSRSTDSLSGGELQKIRLVNQLSAGLTRVLYVLDEPSAGMHSRDTEQLVRILKSLVNKGNTVIVVEHDPMVIRNCDWIVETGPEAGVNGGRVLYNGLLRDFMQQGRGECDTPTRLAFIEGYGSKSKNDLSAAEYFTVSACNKNNLANIDVRFKKASVNVVTGVPGAGKSSLVYGCLLSQLDKAIMVDGSPIGRTPRSNPATYTGMADLIRDLFARQDKAKELGYTKGRFSFNNKGGRCEKCQGAGKVQIGMHYMGNIDVTCDMCEGRRFNDDTLKVKYKGKSISDIYDLSINQAVNFLHDEKNILRYLNVLKSLGLGYLKLGQSSTTLSGGEAQRIKLATALSRKFNGDTWIILKEPTTGLHFADTKILLAALKKLAQQGNTIVAIEYQEQFIKSSDWVIDLGPGCGREGGKLVYEGLTAGFEKCNESVTSRFFGYENVSTDESVSSVDNIELYNCTTNNLRGIDLEIPLNKISVITGVSGSGKSSLAFDTIYSEARSRFIENLSTYSRSFIKQSNMARADEYRNITPAVAVSRRNLPDSPRSTVGTITGVYEKYRYMFSRIAQERGTSISAREFSFNHESGACRHCSGLGYLLKADPDKLVSDWEKSVSEGAMTHNTTIRYYGNPAGQFVALLAEAGRECGIDINRPLIEYTDRQLRLLFNGTGDKVWTAQWHFKNKTSSGTRTIRSVWKGFAVLVEEEYHRKLHNKNTSEIRGMLHEVECPTCCGTRLNDNALGVYAGDINIAGLSDMPVDKAREWFEENRMGSSAEAKIIDSVYKNVIPVFESMQMLGLAHISISRRSSTLSGGEGQRLQLAQQFSGSLSGMTFILDEPTTGLHPDDTGKLISILRQLRERGNTVIIVEHDREIIKIADNIIEMGPGAGKRGGRVVAKGEFDKFMLSPEAITPEYLITDYLPEPVERDMHLDAFGLKGVNKHNLVNRNFSFNANGIIAITGVSGAGKSTLIHHVLAPALKNKKAVSCNSYYENAGFDSYISIDHRPIAGNSMSTLASYTGLLDILSLIFASSPQAKTSGLKRSAFSYNNKEGRCSLCNGAGKIRISMDFMDDVWNTCDKCNGRRYNDKVQSFRLNDLSFADMLELTVEAAIDFISQIEGKQSGRALEILHHLVETGLGHLVLGQEIKSLSGGESQRLKLYTKLSGARGRKILFMLDEPSSGLHYHDLNKLISVFNRLADNGHTVLFIEHNPYLIAIANQVVEL